MTDKERRLLVAVGEALHTFMMVSKEQTHAWPEMRELHDALVAVKIDHAGGIWPIREDGAPPPQQDAPGQVGQKEE